jgi:hypothetical protein
VHLGSHHNRAGSGWRAKALAFSLASTLAAATTGALLGTVGSSAPTEGRVAVASVAAVLSIAIGVIDLGSRRLPVLQCDRETSQSGLRLRPYLWAMRNGAALGIGATSRVGFWLWYLIPVGALLVGSPVLGGLIYGTYGFVRGWSVWLLLLGLLNRVPGGDPSGWLISRYGTAQLLTSGHLLMVGVAVAVAVGF